MKQMENKEQAISDLYIKQNPSQLRAKSAINVSPKKKLDSGQNEQKDMSPRRLNELIESVRKESSRKCSASETNSNLRELVDKYLDNDSQCASKKCSIHEFDHLLKERIERAKVEKLKKLLKLKLKHKESNVHWRTERKASHLREKQERQKIHNDLMWRQREWRNQQRLLGLRNQMEKDFRHIINAQKIQMLRSARRKHIKSESKFLNQLQKQSWRDMKFKQQNQMRVESARKQLQYDALRSYSNRPKSTKSSLQY